VSFDQTLKNSGIGNYLESAYSAREDGVEIEYDRVIFDNLEYLFITLLLIAIISGIIIDKFGELRARREEYYQDCENNCFICGKTKKELDQDMNSPRFEHHIKFEHNLWDYVYFIANIQEMKRNNVENITYVEQYVIDKLERNDNSWLP
jgi:hypothetical protein